MAVVETALDTGLAVSALMESRVSPHLVRTASLSPLSHIGVRLHAGSDMGDVAAGLVEAAMQAQSVVCG